MKAYRNLHLSPKSSLLGKLPTPDAELFLVLCGETAHRSTLGTEPSLQGKLSIPDVGLSTTFCGETAHESTLFTEPSVLGMLHFALSLASYFREMCTEFVRTLLYTWVAHEWPGLFFLLA